LLLDYSEKLWGLPGSELAPEVATRRLSGMGLRSVLAELLLPRRGTAHLDGRFLYPRDGYGAITDGLADRLPGARVHLGREVSAFECVGNRIVAIHFATGAPAEVEERVVSTLPLPLVVRLLGDRAPEPVRRAAESLRFRHVRLLFLRLDMPRWSDNATLYLPDKRLLVSRVSEPKVRSAALAPEDETSLVAEVPCSSGDAVSELAAPQLARRVIDELSGAGLLRASTVLEWRHHVLPNAYPVYTLDYRERVETVLAGVGTIENLDLLGRGGRFWYSHLHDQLRWAKDYVRSVSPRLGTADAVVVRESPSIEAHILRSATKL
jgi:protoporphyrinogen oxidase